MPLYEYHCLGSLDVPQGHHVERYFPLAGMALPLLPCTVCGAHALRQFPRALPLQYFSESNGRIIENLDRTRVLHSPGAHQRLMREQGVEPATQWHTSAYKQTDGLTPRAHPTHPRWQKG